MKALKISLSCALGGAALFGLIGLATGGGKMAQGVMAATLGLLLGLIAAPEFEPNAFRHAALYQTSCGAIAGFMLAGWLSSSLSTAAMAAVIGGLLGWLAPMWVRHVQGP
ncbi:Uncharacterised protein [Bordetella ansorpii]|uniref:Uncharacterized protein n=1 Tax=Bordetella ansorpii TaxID=288768 RepID=A0A157SS02_9BORD|nr:hypothetical protein [Bordetella ansorpii]SAI73199.1 Uncharacterised protein [Bordetella ansorpii]